MTPTDPGPVAIPIFYDSDIVVARQRARALGRQAGLEHTAIEAVATALSEVARNILDHAHAGEIRLAIMREADRLSLVVVASDSGPGIANVEVAMGDGYSTAKGLGPGLPSASRLMDEFVVSSAAGAGTTITMKKWIV